MKETYALSPETRESKQEMRRWMAARRSVKTEQRKVSERKDAWSTEKEHQLIIEVSFLLLSSTCSSQSVSSFSSVDLKCDNTGNIIYKEYVEEGERLQLETSRMRGSGIERGAEKRKGRNPQEVLCVSRNRHFPANCVAGTSLPFPPDPLPSFALPFVGHFHRRPFP